MIKIAGWFGGYLGIINDEIGNKWENLDDFYYSWREKGRELDSFIELGIRGLILDDKAQMVLGTVYYEYIRTTKQIKKKEKRFIITEGKKVIDTGWSKFWLTNKSFILLEKKYAKAKIFDIISRGIFNSPGRINSISFDIEQLSIDRPRQWLGGFRDRQGNIHSGTFYGEDIQSDIEMGGPYQRTTHKNQVGIFTEYFGPEIKVKITRQGYLTIFRNCSSEPQRVFEFIRDELNEYVL
ncbi:hypothetical protein LCGC14_1183720 [marine sediment metagenome]|uniref:Uncharacterized protein n=1 Tax=marine sediment metagenome TaxID=412755 RepID=A0A0F9LLH2_9ZZZZ